MAKSHVLLLVLLAMISSPVLAQNQAQGAKSADPKKPAAQNGKAKNLTHKGNTLIGQENFVQAEANYRRAISADGQQPEASYNLGTALYDKDNYLEAFGNFKQAAEVASTKETKHKAFHNMGNVHMQNKEYERAVESYKQALRNNPSDEETRYNLALAKELLKKQQEQNDKNKDKKDKDQNKDNQDKDQQKDKNNQGGDQEKKDDPNKPDQNEGDQKQEKEDQKKGDGDEKQEQNQKPKDQEEQKKKQQPRPNQLSKEQIQNLLKAMQNEEKKVQQKIDEKKIRGRKIKTEKDW